MGVEGYVCGHKDDWENEYVGEVLKSREDPSLCSSVLFYGMGL